MMTLLKGTGDVDLLTHVPRLLLVPLIRFALRLDARKASPPSPSVPPPPLPTPPPRLRAPRSPSNVG